MQEIHRFLLQVTDNLKTQASFVGSLMTCQKENKAW
jgi:hypothetical protein